VWFIPVPLLLHFCCIVGLLVALTSEDHLDEGVHEASQTVGHLGTQAMIGVTSCLAAEFARGIGLKEQVGEAPASILAVFVLISLASYVPIFRGYTRKEDFSNGPFTPKSENWNGRCAPHWSLQQSRWCMFRKCRDVQSEKQ